MLIINAELEIPDGHPVIQPIKPGYKAMKFEDFNDAPARHTPRQAVFLRNLIMIASETQSNKIPVNFHLGNHGAYHFDRGCMKIAEHAGFIKKMENGPTGFVEHIELNFSVVA